MFSKLFQMFQIKSVQADKEGGEATMPTLTPVRASYKAVDDLLEKSKHLVVKRVGKDIVLIDDKHTHVLSGEKIESIVASVIKGNSTTRIRTSGLSKAQVEKIAGSFVGDKAHVEVRHISNTRKINSLQRFEIVVKGGKNGG